MVPRLASVQHQPAVAGWITAGTAGPGAAHRDAHAVRAWVEHTQLRHRVQVSHTGGVWRRCQVRHYPQPHARPHVQHRLCAGGGGRAAHQPHTFSGLLSREATLFSGECRRVRGGHAPGRRSVLHAAHWHRLVRSANADHWRGPADRPGRRAHRGRAADVYGGRGERERQFVHRRPGAARALGAITGGHYCGAANANRKYRRLQSRVWCRWPAGGGSGLDL